MKALREGYIPSATCFVSESTQPISITVWYSYLLEYNSQDHASFIFAIVLALKTHNSCVLIS